MSDTAIKTEQDLWDKVNHVQCQMCSTVREATPRDLGMEVHNDMDLDDAYEFIDCCNDPFLVAQIVTDQPLFNNDVDEEYHIHANPAMGISERYDYEVGDDLFARLKGEGVLA